MLRLRQPLRPHLPLAGLGEQVIQTALPQFFTPVQDDDPIRHVLDLLQQMAGKNHRLSPLLELPDQVPDFPRSRGIHPRGRLVEHDDFRIAHQRPGQPRPLQHTLGVGPQGPSSGLPPQADEAEKFLDSSFEPPPTHAAQFSIVPDQFRTGQKHRKVGVFRQEADLSPGRQGSRTATANLGAARGGPEQSQNHFHRRALATAVGAKQAEYLPAPHLQIQALQGQHPATPPSQLELLAQGPCPHRRGHRI